MITKKRISGFLVLSFLLLFLTGCDRSAREKEKAAVELLQTRKQLQIANAKLQKSYDEIADLKETLSIVSEDLDQARSELAQAVRKRDDMQVAAEDLAVKLDKTSSDEESTAARVKRLTEDLRKTNSEYSQCKETLTEMMQLNEELESELAKLEAHLPADEIDQDQQEQLQAEDDNDTDQ